MKCASALSDKERVEGQVVRRTKTYQPKRSLTTVSSQQHDIILLGGLSGRLDHTIHTLSYLHKLRKTRRRIFAVSDDNIGWVLDEVRNITQKKKFSNAMVIANKGFDKGEHFIQIDHDILGPTCSLLPVGIDSTVLSTTGPSPLPRLLQLTTNPHSTVWCPRQIILCQRKIRCGSRHLGQSGGQLN